MSNFQKNKYNLKKSKINFVYIKICFIFAKEMSEDIRHIAGIIAEVMRPFVGEIKALQETITDLNQKISSTMVQVNVPQNRPLNITETHKMLGCSYLTFRRHYADKLVKVPGKQEKYWYNDVLALSKTIMKSKFYEPN